MTNRILRHPLLAIFAFLAVLPFASTQNDDHYWTHQYGAKGLLLNGAVIAATEDDTAVFYNPGALGNGARATGLSTITSSSGVVICGCEITGLR